MKIDFCSAPCGSGKTYQLIEAACRIANRGEIVLFVQPTKELIDKTIAEQLLPRSNAPPHQTFYGSSTGNSVARRITEHLKNPPDAGHILFATHQVLPFVQFWPNQSRVHVFIDEELQVVKHGFFKIPHTHQIITDCIELVPQDAIYGRLVISDPDQLELIAKNKAHDEVYELFREHAQLLNNPHSESFVDAEHSEKLMASDVQQLSIHSVLNPDVLDGFASVTMAAANFTDTLVYRLWSHHGVWFQEHTRLSQALRFQKHEEGHLITIKYFIDRPWSRKLQRTPCDPDSQDSGTALGVFVQAIKDEFQDHPFLWQANKSVGDGMFGSHAQRLPNVPHGLNDYSDYDRIAFLSALNPRSDHFRFLASRAVDAEAVRRAIYGSAVYQSVMRTSIRNPKSSTKKTLIVPDASAARYLEEAFPGSRVERLKSGLIDLNGAANQRGRPREYGSSKERQRAYRKRIKESEQQTSVEQKRFPYVVNKSCDEQETSDERYENSIGLNTHFVTPHAVHGTVFGDKEFEYRSSIPIGRKYGTFPRIPGAFAQENCREQRYKPTHFAGYLRSRSHQSRRKGETRIAQHRRNASSVDGFRKWRFAIRGDRKTVSTYSPSSIQYLQSHERKSTVSSRYTVRQGHFRRGLYCSV